MNKEDAVVVTYSFERFFESPFHFFASFLYECFKKNREAWYRFFSRKIYATAPFEIKADQDCELHMVTCSTHLLRTVWSLKSFVCHWPHQYHIVIHDDGSLSIKDQKILRKHFPYARMISKQAADSQVQEKLKDYPYCMRFRKEFPAFGVKLFDYHLMSECNYVLGMDSDYLWFNHSEEISDLVKNEIPFYVGGIQGGECLTHQSYFLSKIYGYRVAPEFNSGLIGISKRLFFELNEIESILDKLYNASETFEYEGVEISSRGQLWKEKNNGPVSKLNFLLEQTTYAIYYGGHDDTRVVVEGPRAKNNEKEFHEVRSDNFFSVNSQKTCAIHHHANYKHQTFFSVGAKTLIKEKFLAQMV